MGRERTEALFDTLLVSDVRIDVFEYGKLGAVKRRNVEPRLAHECEESYCLEGNGLAAGIRSGNDQEIESVSQSDRDRYDFLLLQKRMPSFPDMNTPFCVEQRHRGIHIQREASSCEDEVQFTKYAVVGTDLFDVFCGVCA